MKRNPVARHAPKANRAATHATPKDYRRKPKHPTSSEDTVMDSTTHADGFGDAFDFSHQDALDNLLAMLEAASGELPLPITPGRYRSREGDTYLVVYVIPGTKSEFPVIGFAEEDDFLLSLSWTREGRFYNDRHHSDDLVARIGDLPA